MFEAYFRDRVLQYATRQGVRRRCVSAGVSQGSIPGPDLWDVHYDDILQMEIPGEAFLVSFCADVGVGIVARDMEGAQRVLNQAMRGVGSCLAERGLLLTTKKTEIVVPTRRRIPTEVPFAVGDRTTNLAQEVRKYLGVTLDTRLNFWAHIRRAADKAATVIVNLSRLMANIGGPKPAKRRLLMATVHAVLLYGAEIWTDALRHDKYRKRIAAV